MADESTPAPAKKAAAKTVSTKDTAPLAGHVTVSDASAHDALGRPAGQDPPPVDDGQPFDVKFVDEPAAEDGPAPYSTREGHLTDDEQLSTYGHVLQPDKPFLSEGMRHDIVQQGFTYDPLSGRRVERA